MAKKKRKSRKHTATRWQPLTNREFKSRLFIMYYHDKEKLLDLYNAMSGRHYTDPEELIINTLENAIYMAIRNDFSFIIDFRLSLYEHQSTYNPNIPLRFLYYLADLYSNITKDMNLYGSRQMQIPAPKFVVFHNGSEKRPEYEQLKLSDLYITQDEEVNLELIVDVYNINLGHNPELMESCKSLHEYVIYTSRVRQYAEERDASGHKVRTIEEAVEKAITECIEEGILAEFLKQNRAEAKHMSIYEYDEEKHMKMERAEHYAMGVAQEITQGVAQEQAQLLQLITAMTEDGLQDHIPRLAKEPDFLAQMRRKYNL